MHPAEVFYTHSASCNKFFQKQKCHVYQIAFLPQIAGKNNSSKKKKNFFFLSFFKGFQNLAHSRELTLRSILRQAG